MEDSKLSIRVIKLDDVEPTYYHDLFSHPSINSHLDYTIHSPSDNYLDYNTTHTTVLLFDLSTHSEVMLNEIKKASDNGITVTKPSYVFIEEYDHKIMLLLDRYAIKDYFVKSEADYHMIEHLLSVYCDYTKVSSMPLRPTLRDTILEQNRVSELSQNIQYHINRSHQKRQISAALFLEFNKDDIKRQTQGLDIGVSLMLHFYNVMTSMIRSNDNIIRISNYKYVIFLTNISSPVNAGFSADKIYKEATKEVTIIKNQIKPIVNMGISIIDINVSNADEVKEQAQAALKNSKTLYPQGGYQFYSTLFDETFRLQIEHKSDLLNAVKNNQFHLSYQPIRNLLTNDIVGFDVLLTWDHPTIEAIPKRAFVVLAESLGILPNLTRHIMKLLENDIAPHVDVINSHKLFFNIKLTAKLLFDNSFIETFKRAIDLSNLNNENIMISVKQSDFTRAARYKQMIVSNIKDLNCDFCLEDFGLGDINLYELKTNCLTHIKTKKELVRTIETNDKTKQLINTIVDISHKTNITLFISGIDEPSQLEHCKQAGITLGQGFLYEEPIERASIRSMLIDIQNKAYKK